MVLASVLVCPEISLAEERCVRRVRVRDPESADNRAAVTVTKFGTIKGKPGSLHWDCKTLRSKGSSYKDTIYVKEGNLK